MELRVEKLCKRFGTKEVLKDVSFTVNQGEALGYLGRNGAGKTTTIRILADIFRGDSGHVLLDGKPIDYRKVRLGYLPEERGLYPKAKVGEQMVYIGELRGMTRKSAKKSARDLLEELEAAEYWSKKLETLSKGNQQKIQLAIAVLHNPDIVILDEPFSGLDPVNAAMLKKLIVKEVKSNKFVLFSSHQMPYVEEFCNRICIINQGEIVLNGRINEIKRAYPRNRIFISPEEDTQAYLKMLSANPEWDTIVSAYKLLDEGLEITLQSAGNKRKLMQMLAAHPLAIDKMHVTEPTLEEIFVEKAGGLL